MTTVHASTCLILLAFFAGWLAGWSYRGRNRYRDWRRDRKPRDTWPRIDNSPTGQFKRIVSGRLH